MLELAIVIFTLPLLAHHPSTPPLLHPRPSSFHNTGLQQLQQSAAILHRFSYEGKFAPSKEVKETELCKLQHGQLFPLHALDRVSPGPGQGGMVLQYCNEILDKLQDLLAFP